MVSIENDNPNHILGSGKDHCIFRFDFLSALTRSKSIFRTPYPLRINSYSPVVFAVIFPATTWSRFAPTYAHHDTPEILLTKANG